MLPLMDSGSNAISLLGPTLPPSMGFTRSGSAWSYNSAGLLVQSTANVPRFDYDPSTLQSRGLLVEGAATNLMLDSAAFGAPWAVGGGSLLGGTVTGPDGSGAGQTVSCVFATFIRQIVAGWVSGATGTISIWAKRSTAGPVTGTRITTNNALAWSTGISTYYVLSSSWKRIAISGVLETGNTSVNCAFGSVMVTNAGDSNCVGNMDIWGAQLETGSVATSYIPTAGTSANRAADVPTISVPAAKNNLRFTFDDTSTQTVSVTPSTVYTIPATLNRPWITKIEFLA